MPPLKTGSEGYQGSARCGRIFLWAAEGRELTGVRLLKQRSNAAALSAA
jgi:hypothetical protein